MKSIKMIALFAGVMALNAMAGGGPSREFVPGLIRPMGMVYQKDLLIGVRDRLAQAATSQEKINILQETIDQSFTTENSRNFLERAKNNLGQAEQIIQEAINQYEQPLLGAAPMHGEGATTRMYDVARGVSDAGSLYR